MSPTTHRDVVLITGSSGRIGFAAMQRLTSRFTVVGFDQIAPPSRLESADYQEVDFASEESVSHALRQLQESHGNRLASVLHLAAYYDFKGEPSPKYDEITVRGTERLLRGLQPFEVQQFVFSSTMLVHAPCLPGTHITELSPLQPKWDYPQSKVLTEILIREQHGTIPFVLLRIAGVYDDACHSIPLSHQMQRIFERQITSKLYPGDIARGQAFLHLDDLIDAFERLIDRRAQLPRELTMLLGEPTTLSYDALQRAFGRLIHGEVWETQMIPKPLAKAGAWLQDKLPLGEEPFIKPWMIDLADDHYELDISLAEQCLDWHPRRSLRETLPKMVEALKANPAAWYRENKLTPPKNLREPAAA